MSKIGFLEQCPIFAGAARQTVERCAALMSFRRYPAGHIIAPQGGRSFGLCLVYSGSVNLVRSLRLVNVYACVCSTWFACSIADSCSIADGMVVAHFHLICAGFCLGLACYQSYSSSFYRRSKADMQTCQEGNMSRSAALVNEREPSKIVRTTATS